MKKLLYISAIAFLAACGGGNEPKKTEQLKKLEAERDKLKDEQNKLAAKLEDLDDKIVAAGGATVGGSQSALVSTKKIGVEQFEHFFEIQGTLEADKNITLSAEAQGLVKRINVQEGQTVRAGQAIVELDRATIDQNISAAKESLELDRFQFEKTEKLWKQNIGSELQYRQAKTKYEASQSALQNLQIMRAKSTITAPFSGTVEEIMPKLGESVNPGSPVARIVNLDKLEVKADVSEGYVGKVKYGSNVVVTFPSIGKEYNARIVKVGSSINPSGRTFQIGASISNAGKDLLPNLVAKIKVRDYNNDKAIVVPAQAVLQDINGNSFVYLVEKGKEVPKVKKHAIKTGLTYNNQTEVISGLSGDEEIVVEGVRNVNDGDKVSIAKK
ncbi:MAG: efflux RND transporter periplasmic adaptor subunit [Bacteroidota bacterium]